jgi:hypothetical protein
MQFLPEEIIQQIIRIKYNPRILEVSSILQNSYLSIQLQKLNRSYPNWDTNPNKYLYDIAREGNLGLISYIIKYRNPQVKIDYNEIAAGAAGAAGAPKAAGAAEKEKVNQEILEILERAVNKGANDFERFIKQASLGGNLNILKILVYLAGINKIPVNVNMIADVAASEGNLDIVAYAIENGAYNFQNIAETAGLKNKTNILNLIVMIADIDLAPIEFDAEIHNNIDILTWIDQYRLTHKI